MSLKWITVSGNGQVHVSEERVEGLSADRPAICVFTFPLLQLQQTDITSHRGFVVWCAHSKSSKTFSYFAFELSNWQFENRRWHFERLQQNHFIEKLNVFQCRGFRTVLYQSTAPCLFSLRTNQWNVMFWEITFYVSFIGSRCYNVWMCLCDWINSF